MVDRPSNTAAAPPGPPRVIAGGSSSSRPAGSSASTSPASRSPIAAAGLLEWSESAVAFPGPPYGPDDGPLADTIGGGRGDLAVPRRLLRFLARGARPSLVALPQPIQ